MVGTSKLYYFSPTGGTKRVGEIFCEAISGNTISIDLGAKRGIDENAGDALFVFAVPVFGGRIPILVVDKLQKLDGSGKKAVTMVVYGNRAYEDALLELNNVVTGCGFQVVASCACIAQHSIVPEVAKGRPDAEDSAGIRDFAKKAAEKIKNGENHRVSVPGNYPYKNSMNMPATPISLPFCTLCGKCAAACPTDAISFDGKTVITNSEKCILCMACTAVCPERARILPPLLKEKLEQMLAKAKSVRQENEYFL